MSTDTRFITNQNGQSLVDRFVTLIGNDTEAFDCLVGYFYSSGFHLLSPTLQQTDKIRILIGLSTDTQTFDLIQTSKKQTELNLSHAETKDVYAQAVVSELEQVDENKNTEAGIDLFIKWLATKKLEIRAFPSANLHAKLYILTHKKGSRDKGRVVTGSSNFSISGLKGNLELNVELKDAPDYHFALDKFNELWDQSVDVSEKYIQTVQEKTWFNDEISPYELYLKCLYEYFQEEINQTADEDAYIPADYMRLAYQDQAVTSARQIIKKFGGVFLSDVVGLGKTYISALLAQRLRNDGRISKHLKNILSNGVENSAVLNLSTGEIDGKAGNFLIDERLLSQISFIKEGEFVEKSGSPTLKLVGEIKSSAKIIETKTEPLTTTYPLSWQEMRDAVKKAVNHATDTQINAIIKTHKVKQNPAYSGYVFRNKKQEESYKKNKKLPTAVPSIYNQAAVDFVIKNLNK